MATHHSEHIDRQNEAPRPLTPDYVWAMLSPLLMTLAIASLILAWGSWELNGLNSPLTHFANGSATISLLLVGINEKFSPQPLINHRLRQQTHQLAIEWADAFYTVWAWVFIMLLTLNFCLS